MTPTNDGTKVLIHKDGEEGALHLCALTGKVLTPTDELPIWGEGLIVGVIQERLKWYGDRLGAAFTDDHKRPEAIIMQDLGWVALDPETGEEMELEADNEYRMEVLATVLGVDRENYENNAVLFGHVLAEVEVVANTERTAEEASAIDAEMKTTFEGGKDNTASTTKTANG